MSSGSSGSSDSPPSGGSDDLSALSGFFFYAFIVHPATAWILRPGRFQRKKAILYAIGFLATLAAIKTGLEMQQMGPNHYVRLGVSRNSNPLEIKRAYKKLSLSLHPDKNPSPDAAEEFHAVKSAYEVLMDMEFREVYNKFGADGIKSNKRYDETQLLIEMGVYYLTWGVMAYVLTLGKRSGDARNWVFTGLIVMLVVEVAVMMTQGNPLPDSIFPQTTEYEVVFLMHTLFPAYMNGCRSMGSYLYVDLEEQTRQLLLALQEQNKDILLVMRDVQIGVQNIQTNGLSGGGNRLANVTAGTLPGSQDVMLQRATPTGKLKELQERLKVSNSNVAKAVQNLKKDENKSSSFGFYAMIIGYFIFSFLFK